jgi:integrase
MSLALGLRIGEVGALQFADFDFNKKIVDINKSQGRIQIISEDNKMLHTKIVVGTTKTKCSKRKLPVPQEILDILLLRKNLYKMNDKDFVFIVNSDTDKIIDTRYLRQKFKIVLKKLGIPDATFHTLRHSFATNCIASGVDVKTTSVMLGHSDVKMTLDVYAHPTSEQKKSAINKIGKLFG